MYSQHVPCTRERISLGENLSLLQDGMFNRIQRLDCCIRTILETYNHPQ
jgi:hypothetical protein